MLTFGISMAVRATIRRSLMKTVVLLALLSLTVASGENENRPDMCGPPYVEVLIDVAGGSHSQLKQKIVIGSLAEFSIKPSQPTSYDTLVLAEPREACGPIQDIPAGAVVLASRGTCTFTQKAQAVEAAGGSVMLMYDNQPGCITMDTDHNTSTPFISNIPAVSISQSEGQQLVKLLTGGGGSPLELRVSIEVLDLQPVDAGSLILLVMAVGTVVVGSFLAGSDYEARKLQALAGPEQRSPAAGANIGNVKEEEIVDITPTQAVLFLVVASAMLLILFYFLNDVFFYVLLVMFCIASANALATLLGAVSGCMLPHLRASTITLPCLGPVPTLATACFPAAALLAGVWAVFRHHAWAWILQDILGIALMLMVLRTLQLSSLQVACILLPLCFVYDIFWVFISPLLFHGQSVMVEVAEGGSMHETLPMLLRVPRISHAELGGYSMLGFGDVILPGLLVAYTRKLDLDLKTPLMKGYFVPCCVGYTVGLLTTYAALMFSWFGDQGQPALLYLVPCTLGVVLLLGAVRGELAMMFAPPKQPYRLLTDNDHDSDPGNTSTDVEAQQSTSKGAKMEKKLSVRVPTDSDVAGLPSSPRAVSESDRAVTLLSSPSGQRRGSGRLNSGRLRNNDV